MPLGDIPMPAMPEERFGGTLEIILGRGWRAVYIEEEEILPDDRPALYAYACVVRGDYGYVTEKDDSEGWNVVEGDIGDGESAEEFVARAAHEQTGATISETLLLGYLDCEATSYNEQYENHFRAIRPVYVAVASEVGPVPEGSGYHRRRLPMNQYQNELRRRYPTLEQHFMKGLGRYMVLERTGRLKA